MSWPPQARPGLAWHGRAWEFNSNGLRFGSTPNAVFFRVAAWKGSARQSVAGHGPDGHGFALTVFGVVRLHAVRFFLVGRGDARLGRSGLRVARLGWARLGLVFLNSDGLRFGSIPKAVLRKVRSSQLSAGLGSARQVSTGQGMARLGVEFLLQGIEDVKDNYHEDYKRISKSMLCDFASDKELFKLRYIDGKLPKREPSASMDAGTACHSVLLEGGELEDYVRLVPDDCLQSNGAINGKRLAELKAATPGIVYVKAAEFGRIASIIESVRRYVPEMGIEAAAAREQAVYWSDDASRLDCRCKPDWYCELSGDRIICHDLKITSTVNPWDWGRLADRFRYWLQDAHYSAGLEAATGRKVCDFIFWVVEDQYPFRVLRRAYSDDDRKAARLWHARKMCELAACYQTGKWQNDWPDTIPTRVLRQEDDLELVEMELEATDVPSEMAF